MPRKSSRTKGRPLNGVLLVNKPSGLSSNEVLQRVKYLYFARKAGHTGSLDPLATGMLPICFGEATKLSQFLLDADKHYVVSGKLGVKTNTSDAEGEIIQTRHVDINQQQLLEVLPQFRGQIQQIPSMYSALKFQGKPLYEWARAGVTIERESRPVTIHQLDLLDIRDDIFTLNVKCTKGTYVRNLVEDIGDSLGCGAHVSALHRISAGHFSSQQMISMDTLEQLKQSQKFTEMDDLILPMRTMVENMPRLQLTPVACIQLLQGNPVQVSGAPTQGYLQLYDKTDRLVAIGEINEQGQVAPKRLLNLESA